MIPRPQRPPAGTARRPRHHFVSWHACVAAGAALLLGVASTDVVVAAGMPLQKQVSLLRLAVQEYGEGVRDGQVVDAAELATAAEILDLLAAEASSPELARMRELVDDRAAIEVVTDAYGAWFEAHGVGFAPPRPDAAPSRAAGRELYARYCTACHGSAGDGEGPLAELIEGRPPADFTDAEFMAHETPDEFFQVVTYGLPGSAMPEWGEILTAQERWDLVAHLWALRQGEPAIGAQREPCLACHGGGAADRDLATPGALLDRSDTQLLAALGTSREHGEEAESRRRQLVALARLLGTSTDAAGRSVSGEVDGRHVIHALDLMVEEYGDAVTGGRVIDDVEYGEARLFHARVATDIDALSSAGRLNDGERASELVSAMGAAIHARADAAGLEASAAELRALLTVDLGVADADGSILEEVSVAVAEAERLASAEPRAAAERMLEAYMLFERVEKKLAMHDAALSASLEAGFARARADVLAGRDPRAAFAAVNAGLAGADEVLAAAPQGRAGDFWASFLVILREGLEAILIVGALAAYLTKGGHLLARRWLYGGALVGIAASLATAVAVEMLVGELGLGGEVLEGVTMLLAAAVLFSISYWLVSKVEARHWQEYIRERLNRALGTGSRLAMGGVSFLAVYREGFETVLFYRALAADTDGSGAVLAGFVVGCLVLTVVYAAISRFSASIPIRPFFTATGVVLYLLSFRFLGAGIAELQSAGVLPLTPVTWWPRVGALGMSPDLETGLAQMVLLAAALVAAFVIAVAPRLRREPVR